MNISGFRFGDKLVLDGKLEIEAFGESDFIDDKEAQKIIDHLRKVFDFPETA